MIPDERKEHPRWAVKLRRWFWDDSPDWFPEQVSSAGLKALCFLFGHEPEADQCNIPEHDYCILCHKTMPNQAPGRT